MIVPDAEPGEPSKERHYRSAMRRTIKAKQRNLRAQERERSGERERERESDRERSKEDNEFGLDSSGITLNPVDR
jgi:hypothetical protein